MVTVVAIIAVIASSAAPVASSLFQRRRELLLREHLMVLRQAIRDFPQNLRDDDSDGEIDEDPKGDQNRDGFPGLRAIDDNGDLFVDADWKGRTPFLADGTIDPAYDWRLRADDDEDLSRDEETYPSDLYDLVNRATILRGRIPVDPTTLQPTWKVKLLIGEGSTPPTDQQTSAANNDLDWFTDPDGPTFDPGEVVVVSIDDEWVAADDVCIAGNCAGLGPGPGPSLLPLYDEDPRNGLDDDQDGRVDEDPADLSDISSRNSRRSTNLTTYADW